MKDDVIWDMLSIDSTFSVEFILGWYDSPDYEEGTHLWADTLSDVIRDDLSAYCMASV